MEFHAAIDASWQFRVAQLRRRTGTMRNIVTEKAENGPRSGVAHGRPTVPCRSIGSRQEPPEPDAARAFNIGVRGSANLMKLGIVSKSRLLANARSE
jgi:hypothetical protein